MRNFYQILRLPPGADSVSIERAIGFCRDPQVRADARCILLNSAYRKSYDLAHASLCQISELRASLGMENSASWTPLSTEFRCPSGPSMWQAFQQKASIGGGATSVAVPKAGGKSKDLFAKTVRWVCLVGGALVILWNMYEDKLKKANATTSATRQSPSENPFESIHPRAAITPANSQRRNEDFRKPALASVAMPASGSVQLLTGRDTVAPLVIHPSGDANYLVKLVDLRSKRDVMTVFVQAGIRADVKVPLGTYEVRYASGKTWYGYEHLFGPETSYSKAEESFDFRVTGDRVSGFTVTLYKVKEGNLHTSSIRPQDF